MGTILRIECEHCRYGAEVCEGMGMVGVEQELLECVACEAIVDVGVASEHLPVAADGSVEMPWGKRVQLGCCHACGGEEFHQLVWRFEGESRFVECPKCREFAVVMHAGIWD